MSVPIGEPDLDHVSSDGLYRSGLDGLLQYSLFDYLPAPVAVLGDRLSIMWANQAFDTAFHGSYSNLPLTAAIQDYDLEKAAEEALRAGVEQETTVTLTSPITRSYKVNIRPVPMSEAHRLMLTFYDITEIARTEKMRVDFIANASHELKTPLSVLSGFIETLQGPARGDTAAEEKFLGLMKEQADHMTRLVRDLMSLSKIEQHQHSAPTNKIDIESLIASVIDLVNPEAEQHDMSIELEAPEGLPSVLADDTELRMALKNLIANGIRYGHDGTAVTVRVYVPDALPEGFPIDAIAAGQVQSGSQAMLGRGYLQRCVAISVEDRGDGIAAEHLPRLTERFYCVDQARSRQVGGTGLGLAIVKHVVRRHRGLLDIQSTVGQGSIFTIFVPAAE